MKENVSGCFFSEHSVVELLVSIFYYRNFPWTFSMDLFSYLRWTFFPHHWINGGPIFRGLMEPSQFLWKSQSGR